MSFKIFLQDKEKASPYISLAEERSFYMLDTPVKWFDRIKGYQKQFSQQKKNVQATFCKEFALLGDETILIETTHFEQAVQTARRYFSSKIKSFKTNQLIWNRVHRQMNIAGREKKETFIGFKFFLKTGTEATKRLGDYTGAKSLVVDLDHYILTRSDSSGKYLKLLALVQNDRDRTCEILYNVCMEMDVHAKKSLINEILNSRNSWVRIGDTFRDMIDKPRVNLYANSDKTELYLQVYAPRMTGVNLSITEVALMFSERGICAPVLKENLKQYLDKGDWSQATLIAEGKAVKPGQPAYIENVTEERHLAKQQKFLREGGKKNLSISRIISIESGALIARKHPLRKGHDGKDIYDRVIGAGVVEDIQFECGANTKLTEDGLEQSSEINGNLYRDANGAWTVGEVLEVDAVNVKTGNISHLGTVIVNDSVEDGYSVVASGSIQVRGSVGMATLEAGSDIVIGNGVNGKNRGSLASHFGNIRAKYLQDAIVTAEGNIYIDELISNCQINGGNILEMRSSRGTIWGGKISMTEKIITSNLGSVSGRKTEVALGVPYVFRTQFNSSDQMMADIKKRLSELQDEYARMGATRNKEKTNKLKADLRELNTKLRSIEEERSAMMESMEENYVPCELTIKNYIHANVIIKCQAATIINRRYRNGLVFLSKENSPSETKVEPYVYKDKLRELIR